MNKETIQNDFLAARVKTAVTIMNATGWKPGAVNPECALMDSVFIYVLDYQTQWIWCCSIPRESFHAVLKQSKAADQSASIACCGQMIAACANGNAVRPDQENDLAIALTAYIGITKSYQLTEGATKANHFAVIRYGLTDTLRPFAMRGSARHLIAASEIEHSMKQVIDMDLTNHPEWIEHSTAADTPPKHAPGASGSH